MTLKDTIALHLLFWIYLLAGGGMFYWIENDTAPSLRKTVSNNATMTQLSLCAQILQSVNDSGLLSLWEDGQELSSALLIACQNHRLSDSSSKSSSSTTTNLNYSNAVFLCMTIVTTIGYGNITPKTDGGKIFCIFYSTIGIPLTGIYLLSISDYFSNHFLALFHKIQRRCPNRRGILLMGTFGYLVPGLLVFIFVPAAVFMELEEWTYLDGFYYGFVTLTTIGFGDFVPAQFEREAAQTLYEFVEIFWVILGLAYWTIILNFITKALRSERIKTRWNRTATEMKRMAEHLVMHQQETFIPQKSKAAFDLVFQLAGSFGNISGADRRLSIPGVASAIRPRLNSGFQSMFLPILRLSNSSSLLATPISNKNPVTLSMPSMESDIEIDNTSGEEMPRIGQQFCSSETNLNRVVCPTCLSDFQGRTRKASEVKRLERSNTRPELVYTSPENLNAFKDLIMRAMLLTHEAEKHSVVPDPPSDGEVIEIDSFPAE